MELIKEIIPKRGNVIEVEIDSDMVFYATEYKREQGFEKWSIVAKVVSPISENRVLERLTEAKKIKSKNWANFPDWILI